MADKKLVIIQDRFTSESIIYLQQNSNLEVMKLSHSESIPTELSDRVFALLIRSRTLISKEFLDRLPRLEVIITATSGFDHIDLTETHSRGITVMHTPQANKDSAAQLTIALALNCANKVLEGHKMIKSGMWQKDQLTGFELSKHTWGIVGLGRVGTVVARIAKSFGMEVVAHDPFQEDAIFSDLNIPRLSYEEVLKCSDVLSFHVPKTKLTHGMLNRSHFEYIHRGIILVNTSRGSVINEADLIEALEQGHVRAAGLDVFEKEPLPRTSKLLNFTNVILTPHIGANTDQAFHKASEMAVNKLLSFIRSKEVTDSLPPTDEWYFAKGFDTE